jgi:hypothetical protein
VPVQCLRRPEAPAPPTASLSAGRTALLADEAKNSGILVQSELGRRVRVTSPTMGERSCWREPPVRPVLLNVYLRRLLGISVCSGSGRPRAAGIRSSDRSLVGRRAPRGPHCSSDVHLRRHRPGGLPPDRPVLPGESAPYASSTVPLLCRAPAAEARRPRPAPPPPVRGRDPAPGGDMISDIESTIREVPKRSGATASRPSPTSSDAARR